ncbi:hypothetical protein WN55_10453 [Dufourea novaeangliae]|uniref:Uncharacterized protein n=1 Tax=Dufourea novaeangliae TaxID=178035 RepID=A0A154P3Y9_DUFNO|nr:hypothetical protein WN55_10453 [Dufourea novaeangliae]
MRGGHLCLGYDTAHEYSPIHFTEKLAKFYKRTYFLHNNIHEARETNGYSLKIFETKCKLRTC